MADTDRNPEGLGGYIFVSHSHDDLKKVRVVRNYLESREIEPILFYLHCMKNGNPKDMNDLWELIRREIDARDWFLYLDSENARKSEWVQREMEYASGTKDGHIIRLDLNENMDLLQRHIEKIGRAMRVYLSYARADTALARKLQKAFEQQDFQVVSPLDNVKPGEPWFECITRQIRSIAEDGCFVPLLTENSMQSSFMMGEMRRAGQLGAYIYPVVMKPVAPQDRYSEADAARDGLGKICATYIRSEADFPATVNKIRKALISRITEME